MTATASTSQQIADVSRPALPWSQMPACPIGAAAVGIIASLAPARRGARLNVLHAIGHS